MLSFRRRLLGVALGASLLALMPQAGAQVFEPETFTLENGMKVVVVTNRRAPVVSHMVWYKVGAADEPVGKSGIAHYLEHLMFKGTDEIRPGEFSRTIARNGGRDNAFTSWDYTAYFQNIARDRLELVMTMEADRMVDLALSDEEVIPERAVIMEERRQRTDNDPAARLQEQLWSMLWVQHPYGTPIIGWMHEIEDLTRQDALDFYRSWYAPNNAVLVVSGDVTAADIRPLVQKTYGAVPARPVPERDRTQSPPLEGERRLTMTDSQVQQPSWQRLYRAPSYAEGAEKDVAYALEVLQTIMGGGTTSRLYRELVVNRKIAAGAGMWYSPTALNMGTLGLSASPMPGTDVDAVEAAMEEQIALLLEKGVTAEEVETAKTRLRREAVFARDSLQGPAYAFGLALTTGLDVQHVETWPDEIAEVTVEQVNAAAKLVLGQNSHVTGVLLPGEGAATAAARPPRATPASAPAGAPAGTPVQAGGHGR